MDPPLTAHMDATYSGETVSRKLKRTSFPKSADYRIFPAHGHLYVADKILVVLLPATMPEMNSMMDWAQYSLMFAGV